MKRFFYFILAIFFILPLAGTHLQNENGSFIQTFEEKNEIKLEPESLASTTPVSESAYEKQKSEISKIYAADQPFTALGFQWDQKGSGENVHLFLKYRRNKEKKWTLWKEIQPNIDEFAQEGGPMKTAFLPMNPADAFQYQIVLYGNGNESNAVSNMKITALNIRENIKEKSLATKSSLISDIDPNLNTQRVKIISRSEWGADESLRIYKTDRPPAQLIPIDTEYLEKFSDELSIVRKISKTADGQDLTWPLEYPDKVTKFIIHHTASTANLDDPAQAIRNIYYWHAIGRGWGDIGYNYIIDPEGRIYEGRAGGESVVGAHAGKSNVGSIGISVLGNYQENDVPEKVLKSLMQLIGEKAKIHNIDPDGKSVFRGELTSNVLGHRDVMSTACPGQYIYEKLESLRKFSSHDLETTQETAKFKAQKKKGFDFQDLSKIYYTTIDPQHGKSLTLTLKNTGTVEWNEKTKLIVKSSMALKGILNVSFTPELHGIIKPGETATFKINLLAGIKPKYETLKIAPVINGKTVLEKYVLLPVNIEAPILTYEFVAAKWPKPYLKISDKATGYVELKNTGNVTWRNDGDINIRLGADHPRDRKSQFLSPADTRIAFLKQQEVPPGKVGRFEFQLSAPQKTGNYKEFMTPVIEGVSWLEDKELNFETYVYEKLYDSQLIGMNAQNMKPGETKKAWIKVKNTGGKIWEKEKIKLENIGLNKIEMKNVKMLESSVKPGQTATFEFDIVASKKLGKKKLLLRAKLFTEKGEKLLNKKFWTLEFSVQKKAKKIEPIQFEGGKGGNKLRVLLAGYDATEKKGAIIKSVGGTMNIQIGKNTIATIPANEEVKITSENNQYFINASASGVNETSDEPIKLVPTTENTILQIANYDCRPDWNKSLNDNEFRGTLEVRFIDDRLRIINELPIESYLKGLAEVPNDTPIEKTKAIIVAARTYAYYYSNIGTKFPGKPYHLDDDPDHTQKYRGYGYEKRSPNTVKAVTETNGMVVTYNGQPVLTPYFSTSDGRTRSAQELWGWTNTPYLQSVDDPYCKGMKLAGHGVGMSGCGAQGMAQNGKTYDDILHYYYQGIVLKKMY